MAGKEEASKALRIHEPFGGFRFMKNFYQAGSFEADKITGETLNLSVSDYASVLQSIYGKYAV